jgi:predicted metalloprotease
MKIFIQIKKCGQNRRFQMVERKYAVVLKCLQAIILVE